MIDLIAHYWFAAFVCVACACEMLVQDAIWSTATKAISGNKTLMGAFFNMIGDGLGKATSIVTITLVAHSTSRAVELAQIGGNMIGAFAGVFVGASVSLILDRTFSGWHIHPKFNPLSIFSSRIPDRIKARQTLKGGVS